MKSKLPILLSALLALGFISAARAGELQPQNMNLNLWGNGLSSIHGNFSSSVKSTDLLQTGGSFGIAWQYFLNRSVGVQAGYGLGWQNVEEKYNSEAGQNPVFVVHQITLAGVYNFSELMGSNARFRPYVGAGIGLYPFV